MVKWLKASHGLPPSLVPPFYYLHDELVWELSALHTHWLSCYHQTASPSAPLAWRRDFEDSKHRLRDCSRSQARASTGIARHGSRPGPARRVSCKRARSRSRTGTGISRSSFERTSCGADGSKPSRASHSSAEPNSRHKGEVRSRLPQAQHPQRGGRIDPRDRQRTYSPNGAGACFSTTLSHSPKLVPTSLRSPIRLQRSIPRLPTNTYSSSSTVSTATTARPSRTRGSPRTAPSCISVATSALEELEQFGVDALSVELILAMLDDAYALDGT